MGELRRLKEYLRWGQVQQKLTEDARASNKTYSFFDAASELWRSGAVQRGEELPTVSFLDWDLEDLDGFYRRIEQIPVSMDIFYPAFQHGTSGAKAAEQLLGLDTVPSKLAQDQALGLHRHDCFELFYNLQGSLQLFQENSCQTLPEGALGIISPHLTHDIVAGPGCHTIYIPLAEQTVENTLHQLLRQDNILSDFFRSGLEGVGSGCLVFFLAPGGYIRTLLRNIFHEFYAREEYYQSVCASYIEIFFATVLRRCGGQYTRYSWQTTSGGTAPMLAVLKYLQDNYRTTTLNETAALFHYDPSYLGKQIKAYTGKNYTALIRELRIEMAKRLLRSTDDPMGEIAELAGFDRLSHFSSTFRLATGSSPSEYRRRYSTFRCPEEP